MTIDQIFEKLHAAHAEHLAGSLRQAIEDEALALANACSKWPGVTMKAVTKSVRDMAGEYYAEDITDKLYDQRPLTAGQILSRRRAAIAWAIAQSMRELGIKE